MLYITGTDDPLNPIEGGHIGMPWWGYSDTKPPVEEAIMKWVNLAGCSRGAENIYNKDGIKGVAYKSCKGNVEVIYYTVADLGHHWPGGKGEPYLPERIVGKPSDRLIGNDVIWEFFQRHHSE
jgi:polyhydroxybutyrate depolymerase